MLEILRNTWCNICLQISNSIICEYNFLKTFSMDTFMQFSWKMYPTDFQNDHLIFVESNV